MSRPASAAVAPFAASALSAFEAELDHVYRTFRRLGAQPVEAEDLAQEVFVVALRRWSDYDPGRPLRPWLAGIARNILLDHLRNHSRRELATEEIEQEDDGPGPEDLLSAARARQLALDALASLPEPQRSILVQHDLDGRGMREIADELSLPYFTACSRLRRARLRFAKTVKQLQQSPGRQLAMLSAEAVLAAERALPAIPALRRARILSRLASGGATAAASLARNTALRPPAARSFPLAPTLASLVVLTLLALLLWRRAARESTTQPGAPPVASLAAEVQPARAASAPVRPVPAPRFMPTAAEPSGEETAAPEPLARGLVAHWRFEDGPGSEIARDSSGRGQPCLLHDLDPSAAWVSGPVGGALDLGRAGWLECPMPEARTGVAADLSVSLWMKRARKSAFSALMTRQLQSADRRQLLWFGLRDDLLTVNGEAWLGWTSHILDSYDDWVHVAFVHAGTETRLYGGGVLVRHKTGQVPRARGVVHSALTIGGARRQLDPLAVEHHFDGWVDDVRVYDRALTDTEIAVLAKRTVPQ